MLLKLVVVLMLMVSVSSREYYRDLIPNGHNVLNPCDGSSWPAVGHKNPQGGPGLQQFGLDFAAANHTWTAALCNKDSDGDSKTNGQELGDSNCNWRADDPHAHLDNVEGHPGICEPIGVGACSSGWFTCSPKVPVG